MNKKGISLVSIVLYVVLFFIFMTFAIAMSSNINYQTLSEKGEIINNESIDKLQYNLVNSALNSESVEKGTTYISFSNGDIYVYDSESKRLFKNGGLLIQNVNQFNPLKSYTDLIDVDSNAKNNINRYSDYICLDIKVSKYNKETYKQLFISVRRDEINEID